MQNLAGVFLASVINLSKQEPNSPNLNLLLQEEGRKTIRSLP